MDGSLGEIDKKRFLNILTVLPAFDWVPSNSDRSCYILGTPRGNDCCRTTAMVLETIKTKIDF